ncbi:MAG TPA: MBL fold metallo-hydrolase [Chloroflexota bacterium]|nr:MBL fold metallo-hydrolase [Chloroflexota bacterium]
MGQPATSQNEVDWPHGQALLQEIADTRVERGAIALWHIGQSGFLVRAGALTLLFDPYLSPSPSRTWAPPFAAEALRGVDVVFCSHDHSDHLDPTAVKGIAQASPGARFVVPQSAREKMESLGVGGDRLVLAEVDGDVALNGLAVRTVPAAHGDRADPIAECVWQADPERGYRFVGFVVDVNGVRLYHAGDTTVYPGMVERLRTLSIDVALIPINGRDWFREQRNIIGNTDHREAADLGHAIGARTIVPMHYDMFAGNPGFPGWFVDYCAAQYPGQDFHVPVRCRRWVYVK